MPYMYILRCIDGSYYTGSTWNLSERIIQHQLGEGSNYTSKRLRINYFLKQKTLPEPVEGRVPL